MRNTKLLPIILIAFILFNSCGYILLQRELKPIFKHLAQQKIKSNSFDEPIDTIIVYKKSSRIAAKNIKIFAEDEISFNGAMYDIISKTEDGEKTTYYCINDKNESKFEEIIARLDNSITPNAPAKSLLTSQLHNLVVDGIEGETISFPQYYITATVQFIPFREYSKIVLARITPPPQTVITVS